MFKKILIATDGSDAVRRAAEMAAELAACVGAQLVMLHAVDLTPAFAVENSLANADYLDDLRERGKEILARAVGLIQQKIQIDSMLVEGNPCGAIIETADKLNADLIVLGVDTRGKFSHMVLGSVGDDVVRRATCPVITIHAAAQERRQRKWFGKQKKE